MSADRRVPASDDALVEDEDGDVYLSTLQQYAAALGMSLSITIEDDDG